jgi:hypothetical protein
MIDIQYEVGWYRDKVHEQATENERLREIECQQHNHITELMREIERLKAYLNPIQLAHYNEPKP